VVAWIERDIACAQYGFCKKEKSDGKYKGRVEEKWSRGTGSLEVTGDAGIIRDFSLAFLTSLRVLDLSLLYL